MEEKTNQKSDITNNNEIIKDSDTDIHQNLDDNSNNNNIEDSEKKENEQVNTEKNIHKNEEVNNKAITTFVNQEENSLSNLASSLVSAIATSEKDDQKDEEINESEKDKEINESEKDKEINESEKDKEINESENKNLSDTSEISKAEIEFEFESEEKKENEQVNTEKNIHKNEEVNKAITTFVNQEENSLSNLASSLVSAITTSEKDDQKDEEINESEINENKNLIDTSEISKTEIEFEFESEVKKESESEVKKENESEVKKESESEVKKENEITLVNVLTETDPMSTNADIDDQYSSKDPTFQTGLDNPKRPSSSKVLKRTSYNKGNRTRIVIKSNNNGKASAQRPSTASSIRSRKNSIPSEEECQNALDLMLRKKILPDAEIRPEVINFARKLISRKMIEESYDEATEIDIAIDIMFTSIEDDRIKEDETIKKNNIQTRMDHVMNMQKETHDKYIEMIADEENRYNEKCREIAEKHNREIENFRDEWRNSDRIKAYNKPSSKLFQLRKQQKAMALLHDFQNAKEVKKMADQLEKQEAEAALQRARETMQIEYKQLIEKQQKEIECLKENHEKNITTIKMSQNKDEELAQNTIHSLKFKLETNKPKRPKLMVPVKKQRCNTNSQSVPTTGMITYRTRSQLNNYRKESDKTRLPLKFNFVDQDDRRTKYQSQ